MILYSTLKVLHISFALLSISGFLVRGYWMWHASPWLNHPVTRRLPHVIDTLFLLCGLGLMLVIKQYPFVNHWLTAKVLALVLYILLGTYALKRAPTRNLRLICLILATLTFVYIVGVARTWHPASWLYALYLSR